MNMNETKLKDLFYNSRGYWRGENAVKMLSKEAKIAKRVVRNWLKKQAIWQIYSPPPKHIPLPKFDIIHANEVHQGDLLLLPHDTVGRKTYKYALTLLT